jgi:hypothetical protein
MPFAPRVDKVRYKILRKKAGRSIQILDDNYYAWSFEMAMQKMLKYSLRSSLQCGKLGDYFATTNSKFIDLKLAKYLLSFPYHLVEYNASFVRFGQG